MRRYSYILLMVVVSLLMTACSVQKNTAKSRFWQSFTAKYNTYYNGSQAYIDGSREKEKGNKDNFTEQTAPLHRWQQEQPYDRKRQFRPFDREDGENHQATLYQGQARMEQDTQEDSQGQGVAGTQGV